MPVEFYPLTHSLQGSIQIFANGFTFKDAFAFSAHSHVMGEPFIRNTLRIAFQLSCMHFKIFIVFTLTVQTFFSISITSNL